MDLVPLVEKWKEAVNGQQANAFSALYAPDAVLLVPLSHEPLEGQVAIKQYEGAIYTAFPGATLTLSRPLVQDNTVAVEWGIQRNQYRPVGKPHGCPAAYESPSETTRRELPAL